MLLAVPLRRVAIRSSRQWERKHMLLKYFFLYGTEVPICLFAKGSLFFQLVSLSFETVIRNQW